MANFGPEPARSTRPEFFRSDIAKTATRYSTRSIDIGSRVFCRLLIYIELKENPSDVPQATALLGRSFGI